MEIVVHNSGIAWDKANGIERLIHAVGDSLEPPGRVLICGDTPSDLPMVQYAATKNLQVILDSSLIPSLFFSVPWRFLLESRRNYESASKIWSLIHRMLVLFHVRT